MHIPVLLKAEAKKIIFFVILKIAIRIIVEFCKSSNKFLIHITFLFSAEINMQAKENQKNVTRSLI